MAQKRENEEGEIKVPESLMIRAPPQTQPLPAPPSQIPATRSSESAELNAARACGSRTISEQPLEGREAAGDRGLKRPREACRCHGSGCRKRIGLIGFRCRCGGVFCSEHRYSDRHDCGYDYKAAGREAIARENPVVRAAKILKV